MSRSTVQPFSYESPAICATVPPPPLHPRRSETLLIVLFLRALPFAGILRLLVRPCSSTTLRLTHSCLTDLFPPLPAAPYVPPPSNAAATSPGSSFAKPKNNLPPPPTRRVAPSAPARVATPEPEQEDEGGDYAEGQSFASPLLQGVITS